MSQLCVLSMLAGLEGKIGSNPSLLRCYPQSIHYTYEQLLKLSLPFGAEPDKTYIFENGQESIISYIFEIPHEDSRPDLYSLAFIVEPDTLLDTFELIIKELIFRLKLNNLLNLEYLQENLPNIMTAINKQSKIKIANTYFDVGFFIEKQQLKTKKNKRIEQGGIF